MPDDRSPVPATVRVRSATADDAPALAGLAALTFPLACPPGTSPEAIAEHVASQLSPERFRAWAASAAHALLLVEPVREGVADAVGDVDGSGDGGALGAAGPLGYALLVRGEPDDPDVAAAVGPGEAVELSKIYVHPAAQGTGVAGVLMTAAAEAAARLGPGLPVWLGTNGLNARAQAFYRKHRFAVVGGRTYVVGGETHSDVVMALARS
ncbi:GNAT family N-acetyltransferase [Cellulosimicrobium protaetiae]|uniref:GNAT family N-acetyltransferase n=1 Tax=Cellulosimicrobium protaetiae TaxID=2587808 RepID=A0A6M5UE25_9MICO|nr:GNAT family N-acetyltransferase [Cellulosimicrobium protaetiae]QJW36254.1 GNAT family N-acetyltransferase [Cellulosimicrobium protaetiae]